MKAREINFLFYFLIFFIFVDEINPSDILMTPIQNWLYFIKRMMNVLVKK